MLGLVASIVVLVADGGPAHAAAGRRQRELEKLGIGVYPERAASKLPFDLVRARPLRAGRMDSPAKLDDLSWLEPIARSRRVFLFGESHHNQVTHRLGARVLFALNTYDHFGLITLEQQYSSSAFLDHYVSIVDDAIAEAFRRGAIARFLHNEEIGDLLEEIRAWNRLHPDKRIRVGAHDVEHDYQTTVSDVLLPFFRAARIPCSLPALKTDDQLGAAVEVLERCASKASASKAVGNYPFLTAAYIESVVSNLKSLWLAKSGSEEFERQRAIMRNLTDPAFLGSAWKSGKLFLWGGSRHVATRVAETDASAPRHEGPYLTFDYGPTAGKTFSLAVHAYGLSMETMAGADLDAYNVVGAQYQRIVDSYTTAGRLGLVTPGGFYLYDRSSLNEFDLLLLAHARSNPDAPLLITSVDWDRALARARTMSPAVAQAIEAQKLDHERYDAVVIVPRSPITRAVRKLTPLRR
jgi:hypothetical protein